MSTDFYEWSIPNFFFNNQFQTSFHQNCKSSESIYLHDHFTNHLIQYLKGWASIRGNWVNQFILSEKQISCLINQHSKQSIQNKSNSFLSLVNIFSFQYEQLLFITFIAKFFKLVLCHNLHISAQENLKQISQIYSRYRIQLSFREDIDIGEPPAVMHFLNKILHSSQIKSILYTKCSQRSLLQLFVECCQLQNVMAKIQKNIQIASSQQFISLQSMKCKNDQKKLQNQTQKSHIQRNQFFLVPEKKPHDVISSTYSLSKQKNNHYFQMNISDKQTCQIDNIVKKALQKKKIKGIENSKKLIKTTRHSNFRGKFTKKIQKTPNSQLFQIKYEAIQYNSKQLIIKWNERPPKNKNCQEEISQHDFLCDKSL